MTEPVTQPAYLRWRSDNRVAGTLVAASLSITADALALIFGLHMSRGTLVYIATLVAAAILGGSIMTHNRWALTISKPLVLLLAGGVLAARSTHIFSGTLSLICCALGALLALTYVLVANGQHWQAFMQDVRNGEDTPRAAIRDLRNGT